MGWFVIAAFFGFLGFRQWPNLTDFVCARDRSLRERHGGPLVIVAYLIAVYLIINWALWLIGDRSPREAADILSDGRVARFLLGIVLGAGLAFVLTQRPVTPIPNGVLDADPPGGDLFTAGSESEPMPTHIALSMGAAILVVALTAPHIDGWLRRVTGLKSPLIELQLAGTSTHRIAVVEGEATLFNRDSLKWLISYDKKIESDMDYFNQFPGDLPKYDETIQQLDNLRVAFHDVIGPVANCVQKAIDEGWLSVDAARRKLVPAADLLDEIIFAENLSGKERSSLSNDFWKSLKSVPYSMPSTAHLPECNKEMPTPVEGLPNYDEYKNLPYLHAAAAIFISFMGDTDKALHVLQDAYEGRDVSQPALEFKDYNFLFVLGKLAFYQGDPDDVSSYYNPLNDLWDLARHRKIALEKTALESVDEKCGDGEERISPLCYAQIFEIAAADSASYYLAEDLARGNQRAAEYKARIKELAASLKEATEDLSVHGSNNQFYSYLRDEKYDLLDTYAYATLVLEATKVSPDYDVIRREAFDVLELVTERRGEKRKTDFIETERGLSETKRKVLISERKITQAHLESAKEFLGR